MRRSLYASGAIHAGLLAWVIFDGVLFDDSQEVEFEVTGVTLMSVTEFEALTGATPEAPPPVEVEQPALPEVSEAPTLPTPEAPPPRPAAPQVQARRRSLRGAPQRHAHQRRSS